MNITEVKEKGGGMVKNVSLRMSSYNILYREMVRIRVIEQVIAVYYSEQEMRCPVHFCIGEEAVAVGVSQLTRAIMTPFIADTQLMGIIWRKAGMCNP